MMLMQPGWGALDLLLTTNLHPDKMQPKPIGKYCIEVDMDFQTLWCLEAALKASAAAH